MCSSFKNNDLCSLEVQCYFYTTANILSTFANTLRVIDSRRQIVTGRKRCRTHFPLDINAYKTIIATRRETNKTVNFSRTQVVTGKKKYEYKFITKKRSAKEENIPACSYYTTVKRQILPALKHKVIFYYHALGTGFN